VDALDECSELPELLKFLKRLLKCDCNTNLLATSRKEYDIETELQPLIKATVSMENDGVELDIHRHVKQCLEDDPVFKNWNTAIKHEIEMKLTCKAKGRYIVSTNFRFRALTFKVPVGHVSVGWASVVRKRV
jgi:hypothetical protein